jgi:lipid-A-disaccharide synthase-like uncharacterized protein
MLGVVPLFIIAACFSVVGWASNRALNRHFFKNPLWYLSHTWAAIAILYGCCFPPQDNLSLVIRAVGAGLAVRTFE